MSGTPPLPRSDHHPSEARVMRDYQTHGAAWIYDQLQHHKAVLLADEMGLGKTAQALKAALALGADRILIICPAGARRVWVAEIKRWLPDWSPRVVLVEPGTTLAEIPKTPVIVIVGYDELSNLRSLLAPQLARRSWDLLVLDEAHYLKNPSNRTLAIYGRRGSTEGVQHSAARVILLTGTPTPNHAGELYQHIRTFWPEMVPGQAKTQAGFEERFTRYRDTVFGRQVVGSKNQKILREALAPVVLRRRKDEVLPELPPLILQDIPLQPVGRQDPLSPSIPQTADDDEVLRILRSPDSALATARRELGLLKVGPTIVWVQERMASTGKLLLFAWHHAVIALLARGLAGFGPVVVTGETAPRARAETVERFQTSAGTRIFVGQILAAGTAITLTAANEVAMVEPSWVPGENVQAIARAHRLGQRDSVLASFLYLPGTLDERIMRVFRRKAAEISLLQGDDDADADQRDVRPGDRLRAV